MDSIERGLGLTLADQAQALAAASGAQKASKAGGNHALAVATAGAIVTGQSAVVTASNVIPKVSGTFLIQMMGVVANGAGSSTGFTPAIGHALHGSSAVPDFTSAAATPVAAGANGTVVFQAILGGLTVGTAYDIAGMMAGSQAGGNVADLRLYVQELAG